MVTEMIDSDSISIINLKSIPIYNHANKIVGLRLHNGDAFNLGDTIEFKDYNQQPHKRIVYEIKSLSEFNYVVKVNKAIVIKEMIIPMYFPTIDFCKYLSHCYSVKLNEESITLEYYFDEEVDDNILKHTLFKNYSNVDNMCLYEMYIPKAFKEDYKLIVEGKYSHISNTYKSKMLSFFMGVDCIYTNKETLHKSAKSTINGRGVPDTVFKLNSIFIKSNKLKNHIEKLLDVKLDNNQELASKPNIAITNE